MSDPTTENAETVSEAQAADESSPTLEQKVAAKQAAILARSEDKEVTDQAEKLLADELESDATADEGAESTEKAAESDSTETQGLAFPAGYVRAALGAGLTKEEIDHYIENDFEGARKEFERLAEDRKRETAWYAHQGRVLRAEVEKESETENDSDETAISKLAPLDAKELAEKYNADPAMLEEILGPMNILIDRTNEAVAKVQESQGVIERTRQNALLEEIEAFFQSNEMKSFQDMYGADWQDLTDEQFETRRALLDEADLIIAGALAHEKELSVDDSLHRAHAFLARDRQAQTIRQRIREQMEKRTKTLPSSASAVKTATETEGPISMEELERRTKERLKRLRSKA